MNLSEFLTDLLKKLTSARFWVTLLLTTTFCYITILERVSTEVFVPVLIVVINYYFQRKRPGEEK